MRSNLNICLRCFLSFKISDGSGSDVAVCQNLIFHFIFHQTPKDDWVFFSFLRQKVKETYWCVIVRDSETHRPCKLLSPAERHRELCSLQSWLPSPLQTQSEEVRNKRFVWSRSIVRTKTQKVYDRRMVFIEPNNEKLKITTLLSILSFQLFQISSRTKR